ncbi:MAG: hypothetical protein BroJett003_18680 [Planctomycetota bacterium]|nr:MAG: hypothetical protein BroJett003_18680 [Planctomycetota bacterium]
MGRNEFLAAVCNVEDLPSLPAAALEVMRLSRNEDVTLDQIAGALQNDPALAARLLKVVNSSMFGLSREVTSIRQAVVIVGLRAVKAMALGFSLTGLMSFRLTEGFDYRRYWRRSLTTAAAARQLGRGKGNGLADEAFVAGLLADIGMLAAHRKAGEVYRSVLEEAAATGTAIEAVERARLGVDHAQIGQAVLHAWGLPPLLCETVGAHHAAGVEGVSAEGRSLAAVVMGAARIAALFNRDPGAALVEETRAEVTRLTGLGADVVEETLIALDAHVNEMASYLEIDIESPVSYAQIQAEAAAAMTRFALEAEADRAAVAREVEDARRHAERLEEEKKAILEIASTDGLTGIANRAVLDRRLEEEVRRAQLQREGLSVIFVDIDLFKQFNDEYGHAAGDAILKSVASTLKSAVNGRGLVARYGGEEFAVVVPRASRAEATALAEELRNTVAKLVIHWSGRALRVTASLGIGHVDVVEDGMTAGQLLHLADRAMYTAKRNGRDRVETTAGTGGPGGMPESPPRRLAAAPN